MMGPCFRLAPCVFELFCDYFFLLMSMRWEFLGKIFDTISGKVYVHFI